MQLNSVQKNYVGVNLVSKKKTKTKKKSVWLLNGNPSCQHFNLTSVLEAAVPNTPGLHSINSD